MKKLVLMLCIFMLPLTLASDTQHRFKVCVQVGGNNKQVNNLIFNRLTRQLRLLEDVDVVGLLEDWKYIIAVSTKEVILKDSTKTGRFAIAHNFHEKVPGDFLRVNLKIHPHAAVYFAVPGVSVWNRDNLHEYCISLVSNFEEDKLEMPRLLYKTRQ